MNSNQLRKKFIEFFKSKGHLVMPSASLIPDDPTTLLTSAGMQQFIPMFRGLEKPPSKRVVTCQKCLRADDIEEVGKTTKHLTFFEMPGNFSFGDYFKEEAIIWAWELIVKELGISPEDLWVSVYEEDSEAYDIWAEKVGIKKGRIVKLGKKDNWWVLSTGIGPCGPCSEIYFDLGDKAGCQRPDCAPGCDCDRFVEIWNLVFQTYNADKEGNLEPLPSHNIDTGLGLERTAMVLQGGFSVFETDLFQPIINYIVQIANEERETDLVYRKGDEKDRAIKAIADHSRAISFMIVEGIMPSNEGRGYVLRRILRRAYRLGKALGIDSPFLHKIVPLVSRTMSEAYPELKEKESAAVKITRLEEERFQETLEQGMNLLQELMIDLEKKGKKIISGEDAFKLYDTYGFPLEMTREIVSEAGFEIDEIGFREAMEEQRRRSRAIFEEALTGQGRELAESLQDIPSTKFLGYEKMSCSAYVLALIKDNQKIEEAKPGDTVKIILDQTPFYGEMGGQVGDQGKMESSKGFLGLVKDTQRLGEIVLHEVEVKEGNLRVGEEVVAEVDSQRRRAIARSHTATHLLHYALRKTLGAHVVQSGSLVEPDRLRFDFSHFQQVSPEELRKVEEIIHLKILEDHKVEAFYTTLEEAKKMGALALFGEKYVDPVRAVKTGDFSLELCGGTHLEHTSQIGICKIIAESSIGAGLRRIEALTGQKAWEQIRAEEEALHKVVVALSAKTSQAPEKVAELLEELKEARKSIAALQREIAELKVEELVKKATKLQEVTVISERVDDMSPEAMRWLADKAVAKVAPAVIVLGCPSDKRLHFVCAVSKELVARGFEAKYIISEVAKVAGGGGGGRADFAQAGGKEPSKLNEALRKAIELVADLIKKGA